MSDRNDDLKIARILQEAHVIAVVGASTNWKRPSFFVLKYLLEQGYDVIPVNPKEAGNSILGQTVVASLTDIHRPVDMVDVFRRSEECPEI
ncbi:MAG TPA: O-acetylhomoserine/O-acetylserine sulfhydrylase, partial [Alphaproteobacteria bacterium]|nr:O-acetylhomoserine/O-acetylserine sulfhydrylase [Alphaproteobacteria bacterium]